MKKVDMKQWLEAETKKVISDKKKYNRDLNYKKELDQAVIKKIFLMVPLIIFIVLANHNDEFLNGWFRTAGRSDIKTNPNVTTLFPNVWVCPKISCGYSNYDGISSCALCGTARP